jgi:hypothetical protein
MAPEPATARPPVVRCAVPCGRRADESSLIIAS